MGGRWALVLCLSRSSAWRALYMIFALVIVGWEVDVQRGDRVVCLYMRLDERVM